MDRKGEKKLKLQLQHGFGSSMKQGYLNSLGISQEDGSYNLIYPLGKYIGVKSIDRQDMSFIKLSDQLNSIDCMAISPNKKYIAIAEKPYDGYYKKNQKKLPILSVYNYKYITAMKFLQSERKTLTYTETEADRIIHLRFSEDSRFLVMQTSDYKLVFLEHIQRLKEVASGYNLKQPATRITINPLNSHQIIVTGKMLYQTYTVKEQNFFPNETPVKKLNPQQNFVDHCWLDEYRIALANDKQEIFIIDYVQNELKQEITDVFQNNYKPGYDISCLINFSKGLIISSTNSEFSIWIKNEDANLQQQDDDYPLVYLRSFNSQRKTSICAMDIAGNDDLLGVAFTNNDIATFDLTKVLPQVAEPIEQYKRNKTQLNKKVYFDYVYKGFHGGPISQMDVCIQRPLLVTISQQDSTLRIWNYRNYKCEYKTRFQDKEKTTGLYPLLSVAIHPSGYQMAVGCIDKLKIFHVLNNDLRLYKELVIKSAAVLKYSNGGQYLAVSYPRPKTTHYITIIYNSYTFEILQTLKTHTQQVTDIVWDPKDEVITTCANDGMIFEYRNFLHTSDKNEHSHQNLKQLHSMVYNEDQKLWMVAGYNEKENMGVVGESFFNEKEQEQKSQTFPLSTGDNTNYRINSFQFAKGYHNYTGIVAGLNDGHMVTYGHSFSPFCNDMIQAHTGDVTKVKVSPDGLFAFSGGNDGCVFIYQIQEINEEGYVLSNKESKDEEVDLNPRAFVVDTSLADVVLVDKDEIDKYLNEQKKLQNDYEDLGNRMEYQTQEEKKRMDDKIKEMENKKKEEIKQWTQRYEELKNQKTKIEKESAVLLKGMENNHLKAVEELEMLYEKKLGFENEKFVQQEEELLQERVQFDSKLKEIEVKHESNIGDLKCEFNNNFSKAQNVFEQTKRQANELNQHYEEKLDQQEEEHEMEIRELNEKQAKKIAELKDKIADLQSKNDMFKREEKTIEEKMLKMKKNMMEGDEKCKLLEQRLSDSNNQIEVLKSEIKNLEEQLMKKEKKIHEYKYKINDLQKSKHVLSFRATEMRKSLEPKEAQIDKLKDELFKLEGEFEQMLKNSEALKQQVEYQETKISTLKQSLKDQKGMTNQKDSLLNKILMQIYVVVQERDSKYWNTEMQKLYNDYVENKTLKSSSHDAKGVEEMSRHIQHLEKSLKQMNISSEKIILSREQEVHKKLTENAELIYDLNEMRKLNKDYLSDLQHKKMEIDNLTKERDDLVNQLKNYQKNKFPGIHQNNLVSGSGNKTILSRTQNKFMDHKAQIERPQSMKMPLRQKGKIVRGPNFDSKTLGNFERAKIQDMHAQIELYSNKIMQQEGAIKEIRSKIREHVHNKNCQDLNFDDEIQQLNQLEQGMGGFGSEFTQNMLSHDH